MNVTLFEPPKLAWRRCPECHTTLLYAVSFFILHERSIIWRFFECQWCGEEFKQAGVGRLEKIP